MAYPQYNQGYIQHRPPHPPPFIAHCWSLLGYLRCFVSLHWLGYGLMGSGWEQQQQAAVSHLTLTSLLHLAHWISVPMPRLFLCELHVGVSHVGVSCPRWMCHVLGGCVLSQVGVSCPRWVCCMWVCPGGCVMSQVDAGSPRVCVCLMVTPINYVHTIALICVGDMRSGVSPTPD